MKHAYSFSSCVVTFMKKNRVFVVAACTLSVIFTVNYLSEKNVDVKTGIDHAAHEVSVLSPIHADLLMILEINNKLEKVNQLNQFFLEHMGKDALKILLFISNLNNASDRQLSYDLALAVWFSNDAYAMTQWLSNESPREDFDLALRHLIVASSRLENSLLFAEKMYTENIRKDEITRLFKEWVSLDAKQIVHWSIASGKDSVTWLRLAFTLFNNESHLTAIQNLAYMNAENIVQVSSALQIMIDNYTFGIVKDDALVALHALTPYKIREEAIVALLPLYANEKHLDLDMITALVDGLLPGTLQDELYELLALNWVNKNPSEAGELAQSLTGDIRAQALSAVAGSWAKKDLRSADEWLKTVNGNIDLASGTIARESAILGNTQISDEWLDDIIEEDIRDAAIKDVLQSYYQESPAAGIYHLVYQKNLTVEKKLQLLHEIYPDEFFLSPNQALDEIGRLEGLQGVY